MKITEIKRILPKPLRGVLGKARAIGRRLNIWRDVYRYLSGVSDHDKTVLRRAILSAPVDVFRGLDRWRDPVVSEDCKVKSKGIGVFSVRAYTDDLYHTLPSREPSVIGAIRSHLKPGDVFVDAGANIGVYSVLASKLVGQNGIVISFEMMPETASILRDHLSRNQCENATVIQGALSDVPGKIVTAYSGGDKHGQSSIIHKGSGIEVSVETKTLEMELHDLPRVQLMKMDLEGAELQALKGLGNAISKIDAIIFEARDRDEASDFLSGAGFLITRLDGKDKLAVRQRSGL